MSFRDRPNLLYFDILKCATSVNVMASVLNGFQCPTTQVHTAAAVALPVQTLYFPLRAA